MFNRIEKHRICPRYLKTVSRNIILKLIFQNLTEIALYHYYKSKGFIYLFCLFHSDYCSKCIRNNQSYYNVRGLSILQFRKIVIQYFKVESEFIQTEKK